MSQDYQIILLDDFDWAYANTDKAIQQYILSSLFSQPVHSAPYMLIVNVQNRWPEDVIPVLRENNIVFDVVYYQAVPNPELIRIYPPEGRR